MMSSASPSADDSLGATGSFVSVPCPECWGTLARRSHRNGLVETILRAMYVFPFRCQLCGHRFFALQWSAMKYLETDAREYHRYPVQIPVLLSGRHGEFLGTTTELSFGGCTLLASGPFRESSRWSARLLLPSDPHPVIVNDAVVRTVHSRQIGMEFLLFPSSGKQRFGRYIESIWKQAAGSDEGQPPPREGHSAGGLATQPGQSASPR